MIYVVLCSEAPESSTSRGSASKTPQKMGPQLKYSSDRLVETGDRPRDPLVQGE